MAELRAEADAYGFHGPVVLYSGGEGLLDPLGVRSIPGLAFVDARGVVVAAATGNRDRDFILRHARALTR